MSKQKRQKAFLLISRLSEGALESEFFDSTGRDAGHLARCKRVVNIFGVENM